MRAIIFLAYGSGLRISEICTLKTTDIDSKQMRILVHRGKGGKERYTILSRTTLEALRTYWKTYRPVGNDDYLFFNKTHTNHISPTVVGVEFKQLVEASNLRECNSTSHKGTPWSHESIIYHHLSPPSKLK